MRIPFCKHIFGGLLLGFTFQALGATVSQVNVAAPPIMRAYSAVDENGVEARYFQGKVTYMLLPGEQDSCMVSLAFEPVGAGGGVAIVEQSGDVGLVAVRGHADSVRTIFFRCKVLGAPASQYQARVSVDAEKSRSEAFIDSLLKCMTRDEKIEQCHGTPSTEFGTVDNERLHIPGFHMADGPNGVRWPLDYTGGGMGRGSPATLFPSGVAMASTWDTAMVESIGVALGQEFRANGINMALGPMMNIVRDPRGGRDFETFSEDPYLTGRMAVAHVRGMQSVGVIATPKHFACYSREIDRMSYDVNVSERALQEIFLPAFHDAVADGGALAVMAAYPKVNGMYCTAHRHLLRTVLKGDWGFDGVVISDWGALHSVTGPANAGLDIDMPNGEYYLSLGYVIDQGWVADSVLDEMVKRILRIKLKAGMLVPGYNATTYQSLFKGSQHRQITLEAARKSIVLAKNQPVGGKTLLPIDPKATLSIALVGRYADSARVGGWRQ